MEAYWELTNRGEVRGSLNPMELVFGLELGDKAVEDFGAMLASTPTLEKGHVDAAGVPK